ncbi:hypothetical protein HPG69_012611 [Diceros bicornis minor]|uniref:Uncharacterized protein n=1 Tax=Diceros bicornis minor TaxID=77932 RepID=A0A7J7F8R8_DICBM|nr:hypothetical protein HPG69_012611 [Diceros bicornis minor]
MAIQSLLRDEASAVQALNELPVDLFPLVLTVAFRGKQRKVLRALVQAWPFPQLCLAPLLVDPASCQDSLWAVLDGLDARPARGVPSRKSNLKVVDFRPYFELVQSNDSSKDAARSLSSFATWMEPEVTLPETKPRQRRSWKQPWKAWQPVDLYINLSLGTFHGREFFSGVLRKVKQSYRPLRLFCRKLHVKDMPVLRIVEILNLLQLEFIQELELSGCFGLLSGGSKFASQVEQMKNLCSLTLSHPIFGTSSAESQLPSEAFISFLSHLSKLGCLRMLHLSSEDISGHLHHLFR